MPIDEQETERLADTLLSASKHRTPIAPITDSQKDFSLADAGVVRDLATFRYALARSGQARRLKAGEYRFDRPMKPAEVIDMIAREEIPAGSRVLYAHLGGVPAINAYSFLYRNG